MRSLHVVVFCAFVSIVSSNSAWAQATAQLGGRVTDQSGAVLPGVSVTATQTDTGLTRTVVTRCWKVRSLLTAWLFAATCFASWAQGVDLLELEVRKADSGLVLDYAVRLQLPRVVDEALRRVNIFYGGGSY